MKKWNERKTWWKLCQRERERERRRDSTEQMRNSYILSIIKILKYLDMPLILKYLDIPLMLSFSCCDALFYIYLIYKLLLVVVLKFEIVLNIIILHHIENISRPGTKMGGDENWDHKVWFGKVIKKVIDKHSNNWYNSISRMVSRSLIWTFYFLKLR